MAENKTWEQEAGRVGATLLDPFAQLVLGVSDALEGVVDLGIGAVGAVGGLFSEDFREGARDAIEYDFTGEVLEKTMDDAGLSHSYLNDHPVGEVAQEVFRGVGNMLPAVAASVLTVGAAAPAMGTAAAQAAGQTAGLVALGGSAAGGATEEAFRDGAGYYEGLGYGAASGAVEVATEKLFGGVTGKVFGKGMLDDVSGAVAKTGARRVLSNMGEEAVEEAAATFVNPALKSIYRGRDAWSEYGDPAFYGEVGRSALVGGLTSAVYGGTVGHAMHTSGKDADIADSMEEIGGLRRKQMNLWASDALTDDARARLLSVARGNLANVEAALQKASVKERARLIEQHRLSELVDADGKLRPHAAEKLINEPIGVETEGSRDAGASFDRRYMSPGLWNKRADVQAELDRINADLRQKYGFSEDFAAAGVDNGEVVQYNKKYPKRKKVVQTYSQYATEVMIWARSAARSIGDTRIFYDEQTNTYNKIVVDDSEDGYGIYDSIEATPRNEQAIQLLYEEVNHDRNRAEQGTHQGIYENYDRFKRLQRRYVHDGNSTQIDRTDDRAGRMDGKATAGDFDGAGNRGESTGDQQSKVKYSPKPTPDAAFNIEIFEGELSEQAQKNYLQMKKAFSKLSEKTPTGMHFVLVKPNEYINGAILQDGNTVYIAADTLENGTWAQKLVHEVMHFAEGSREYKKLVKHLAKDSNVAHIAEEMAALAREYDVETTGSTMFSMKHTADGEKFVAIEPSSVADLMSYPGESLAAKARSYLKQFRGTVLPLGSTDKAFMRREAEGEYTNPAKGLDQDVYEDKLKAASEIQNLLHSASYLEHRPDNGRHKDAVRGWNYYQLKYVVPDENGNLRAYSAEIQIKLIERGDCFYDITKIQDITSGTAGQALIKAAGSAYDVSTNSIPDSESNVKSFAEKIMDGEDLELSGELAAQMAEEVLGNEEFIGRLVNEDAPLAEKIMGKIRDLISAFSRLSDPAARAEHKRLQKAEKLYLTAVEHAGYRYVGGKLQKALANDEEREDGVQYAIKYPSFSKEDILGNMDTLADMDAVAHIDASKLEKSGKSPKTIFEEYFESLGNSIYSDVFGDIAVGKSSVKSEIRHGITATKLAAIEAIPNVIEHGKVVFFESKLSGDDRVKRIVIAAPIQIASAPYYMGVMLQRDPSNQYLYLHNVALQKEMNDSTRAHLVTTGADAQNEHLSMTIILQKAINVKLKKQKNKGKISYSLKPHVPSAAEAKRNFALTKTAVQKAERTEKINDLKRTIKERDDQTEAYQNSVDDGLLSFVDSVSMMENKNAISKRKYSLGKISQTHAQLIEDILSRELNLEIDISEYTVNIDGSAIKHISYKHGENGTSDRSMQNKEDLARVGWVANNAETGYIARTQSGKIDYDSQYKNKDGSPSPKVILAKDIGDSKFIVIECVPDTEAKKIHVISARKIKSDNGQVLNIESNDSPQPTSETLLDGIVATNSIPDSKEKVNRNGEKISYSLKQTARTEKINDLKRTIKERDEVYRLSNRVLELAGQIKDLKLGTYHSVSEFNDARFRGSIEKLASIKLRGNLSVPKIRKVMSDLYGWYDPESPFFAEQQDLIRPEVREMMKAIAQGEGTLSANDLRLLVKTLEHLKHFVTTYQKVYAGGQYVDAKPLAEEFVKSAHRAKRVHTGVLAKIMRSTYMQSFMDPAALFRAADAYDEKGFYTVMFEMFRRGAIDAAVTEMELLAEYEAFLKKNKKYQTRLNEDTVDYGGEKLSVGDAISLYMTSKRKQAQAGLVHSGFAVETDGEVHRFLPIGNPDSEYTEGEIARLCENLADMLYRQFSETDKQFISIVEKTMNGKCAEYKRETDLLRLGYTNIDGEIYYYSIFRNNVYKSIDTESFMEAMDRVSNLSINKDTVKGAKGELRILSVDRVFSRHVHQIAIYRHLAIPTDTFNRTFNLNVGKNRGQPVTVKTETVNLPAYEYFQKLKADVEGASPEPKYLKAMHKVVGRARGAYATYQLGFNPKTLLTQLSSFAAAGNLLDVSSIIRGMGVSSEGIDDYCPLAKLRNYDNAAARSAGVLDKIGKVGEVTMKPIGRVDRFVITRLFGACQVEIETKGGAKVGTKENKEAAGKLLERVILETQQNALATERSGVMRSGDELFKSVTMFSADSMKMFGRFLDAFGEVSVLQKELKSGNLSKEAEKDLRTRLQTAQRQAAKSSAAMVSSAVMLALVAWFFNWLYGRIEDRDRDGEITFGEQAEDVFFDIVGNMIGGLPAVRDVYTYFTNGYEVENFLYSMANDMLGAVMASRDLAQKAMDGKEVPRDEVARTVRKAVYAGGVALGIPARNVYNFSTGILSKLSPETGYYLNSLFAASHYRSDLLGAIEAGDEKRIHTVTELIMNEDLGVLSQNARKALRPLVEKGLDVLPRAVGDTVTYEGEEYELTRAQKKRFKEINDVSYEVVEELVKLDQFKKATDEEREKALRFVWETYRSLAIDDLLGTDSEEKKVLFAQALPVEKLAIIVSAAKEIKADTNALGKTVVGSRKKKILSYIEGLHLTATEKYMVAGYLGFVNQNGREQVWAHIRSIGLSKAEQEKLLEYSGYKTA